MRDSAGKFVLAINQFSCRSNLWRIIIGGWFVHFTNWTMNNSKVCLLFDFEEKTILPADLPLRTIKWFVARVWGIIIRKRNAKVHLTVVSVSLKRDVGRRIAKKSFFNRNFDIRWNFISCLNTYYTAFEIIGKGIICIIMIRTLDDIVRLKSRTQ